MAVHKSVLDLIGDTPIIDVSQLSPNPGVRILAKLEGQNPAGSVKDNVYRYGCHRMLGDERPGGSGLRGVRVVGDVLGGVVPGVVAAQCLKGPHTGSFS